MTMFSRVFASRSNARLRPALTANSHVTKTGPSPDERFNKLKMKSQWSLHAPHSGHYMHRTAVTICTAQRSLYVPHSGHCTYRTVVTICTARFNIHKFYDPPTHCIYVFCTDLRTNSDYFPIQHQLTGFYNRDGVCLLRGTDWIFVCNSAFCPHSVFMCFVWISEQTAIISLYNIN